MEWMEGIGILTASTLTGFGGCAILGLFRWGIQRIVSLFKKILS